MRLGEENKLAIPVVKEIDFAVLDPHRFGVFGWHQFFLETPEDRCVVEVGGHAGVLLDKWS